MKKLLLFSILTLLTFLVASAAITYSRELEERAILGDNVAMWQLSQCYRFSFGVAQNLDKADYWLDRAAEEGNVDALNQKVLLNDKGKRLSESKRRELAAVEQHERERLLRSKEEQRKQEELKKQVKKQTFTANGVSFTMVEVLGGTFIMGDTSKHARSETKPAHNVTLSSYYIGETEVTQELWQAVMGFNPSYSKGSKKPVEDVSWNACQEFIKRLNIITDRLFRLPTEAEWEFAARGGNLSKGYKYSGSDNLDDVAWSAENSGGTTHNVATKQSNELGLYDMSGNVDEWCQDWYGTYSSIALTNPDGPSSGDDRVLRGDCYNSMGGCVSDRHGSRPIYGYRSYGLRLAEGQRLTEEQRLAEEQRPAEERRKKEELKKQVKEQTFTANGVSFTMVEVQGGTFNMGSIVDPNERPVHKVTLSSYYIGETEVTQELWQAVMGEEPVPFKGNKYPVVWVSWKDCEEFIKRLNKITGKHFRLPTEAEWEFAARGGNLSKGYQYSGSDNLDDVAWYGEKMSSGGTHKVATKGSNELGLYDMSGNVWEWCSDWDGPYSSIEQTNPTGPRSKRYRRPTRVVRGGSWNDNGVGCRVSHRSSYIADKHENSDYLGLRLAL